MFAVSWWGKDVTSSRRAFHQSLPFFMALLKEMCSNDGPDDGDNDDIAMGSLSSRRPFGTSLALPL